MWSAYVLRLPLLFLLLLVSSCAGQGPRFQCSSTSKCQALAGYVATTNGTTYDAVRSVFQVDSIYALYGANGIDTNTSASTRISANTTVRVPFPCACANGTGVSDRRPVYTVKTGDDLDKIAREIFQGLVTYQQIAAANGIVNTALIQPEQKLWIPLPCSCDPADGADAVHLAHVVEKESNVAGIAREFGTTEATLLRVNNMADPRSLQAGQILDVPLRACNSSIRRDSPDFPLRVPRGSYALTAGNCVMCSCDALSWRLQCETALGMNVTQPPSCAAENCRDPGDPTRSVPLGSLYVTTCASTECIYTGYDPRNFISSTTPVVNDSLCETPSPRSAAHSLEPGQLLRWTPLLLVFFHMGLFLFAFL